MEFTEKEVQDAFAFIDLNHNSFISAGEIRHILICMGELITDEEIDEMIRMVDLDGDGQVSYEEFHRMAMDPDPSRPDFNDVKSRAATGGPKGMPLRKKLHQLSLSISIISYLIHELGMLCHILYSSCVYPINLFHNSTGNAASTWWAATPAWGSAGLEPHPRATRR